MESVIVVTDSSETLPLFEKLMRQHLPSAVSNRMTDPEEFTVESSSGQRIYFRKSDEVNAVGWDENELLIINHYFSSKPMVYTLSYREIDFVKWALSVLVDSSHYLIDNDCGTLLPGHEFVLKMRKNPNWYWFDDL
ncbi:hypothetical protein [Hymenobacter aerophilus]|uniref:hypothetical protein n=1 Tax=Hymenobacter aerophilus TaxID=119644 RepID=UPI00047545C2|nr:hypothetical protein [Hymenobacter aerophilus]